MSRIVIQPRLGAKATISAEEFEELRTRLQEVLPDHEIIVVEQPEFAYGLTWWEIVIIWLGLKAAEAAVPKVLDIGVDWARGRFGPMKKRPKYIAIYGPDGQVIESVVIKTEGAEAEHPDSDPPLQPPPELESGDGS